MGRGFLMLALWLLNFFLTVYSNVEGDALITLMSSLSDPLKIFGSWNASQVNPCGWFHVTCNNDNSVTRLDLQHANLSGHLVPQLGLLPNLQYLELFSNNISGEIPRELGNLKSLVSLDLYLNKLSGPIPDELGKLSKLRFLRLNNNSLSGTIPMSLTSINSLQVLDLSSNNLSGIIPQNGSFTLFKNISFEGNPYLKTATPSSSQSTKHARAILIYTAGAIVLFAALSIAFVCWRRRKHRVHFFDPQAKEDCEVHLGQLKRFSLKELQAATNNFHHKNFVGGGGFGEVYKGSLADGSLVAVKRLRVECTQGEELRFQTELQMISMAVHRNLIQLRGFCMNNTERLLVYPFMANGSVASCLRALEGSQPLLDWSERKQVALGSARGLAYLHHQCDTKIIHRDVKAASILLDEEFEAVVGDFGLAKMMGYTDTHVTTVVCGTTGHIAPEYFYSGKCSEKTDVFGYGVMLLELITGQQASDLARLLSDNDVMVHDWVKGLLKDKKLHVLVDVNLQGNYIQEELEQLIQISLLCTESASLERPTMSQVVNMLKGDGLGERWEEWQKQKMLYQEFNHDFRGSAQTVAGSLTRLPIFVQMNYRVLDNALSVGYEVKPIHKWGVSIFFIAQ